LVFFTLARERSEVAMRSNHFDSMNFGINLNGQGTVNAVERTHRITLRALITKFARRLSLRGSWRALKRSLAGSLAIGELAISRMTPAPATCPSYSATRFQRDQRWMSGVVVDPGTVGVG
jgi:hypothetical protein